MGRMILFEASVEDNINTLFSSSYKLHVGLILGQQSDSKDFGVHLVKCPDPVEDVAEIEMSSSFKEDVFVVKAAKPDQSNSRSGSLLASEIDVIDIKWVAEHGRQVNRMLTGGISVLGMFVYCSPDVLSKNQSKIPQCMINLHKKIERNKFFSQVCTHNERYMLHICSVTRKLTCRTISISEDHPTLKPAEYRYQSFLNGWNSISTIVDTHINVCIPLSEKATIESKILIACKDEIENIQNSYATIDHKLVDDEELISKSTGKSKGKSDVGKELNMTLFKTSDSKKTPTNINFESVNLEVKFFGSIESRAFLNSKATYKDAVQAIKSDIIRSLLTRIELLCEEAEVNNLDDVEEWSLVSPTRVFVPFGKSQLLFCDYSFKDESHDDIAGRFTELLSFTPESADFIFHERSPDVSEVSMIFHRNEKAIDQQSDIASEVSNSILEETPSRRFIYAIIGLIILLIAIAIHLLIN